MSVFDSVREALDDADADGWGEPPRDDDLVCIPRDQDLVLVPSHKDVVEGTIVTTEYLTADDEAVVNASDYQ